MWKATKWNRSQLFFKKVVFLGDPVLFLETVLIAAPKKRLNFLPGMFLYSFVKTSENSL